jgi:hypothetical protein
MSADNGVYILPNPVFKNEKWEDGEIEYRVAHAHAIENIDFPSLEKDYEWLIFHKSEVFKTRSDAILEADRIYLNIVDDKEHPSYCEYGMQFLELRDHEFPKLTEDEVKKKFENRYFVGSIC